MQLYDGSLSVRILEYLLSVASIPRKNLYTPFATYNYDAYSQTVRRLLTEDYIQLTRKNQLNHISITPKGVKAIGEKQSNNDIKKERNKALPKTPKEQKRAALVNDVLALCEANGIATSAKPPFDTLFAQPAPEQQKKDFVNHLKDGLFYSTGEIRTARRTLRGENDISNLSRLIGVIFKGTQIRFLYSINDKLILWVPSNEERVISTIIGFLKSSPIISEFMEFPSRPTCIVCGKGYTMIPKIVTGRKWGRIDESKNETFVKNVARTNINSYNLSKVFDTAYYVPAGRHGINLFKLACSLSETIKDDMCEEWFENTQGFTRLKTYGWHQGLSAKGQRTVFMPYMDLIELEAYKKQGTRCHFIIPKGTQEAVARVMGPLLISARTRTGEILKHGLYDALGAKL